MYKDKKIIYIYGASGAGSTTLGEELTKVTEAAQFDTDLYFWKHYEKPQKRMDDMFNDIKQCSKQIIVITGSFWNWECEYSDLIKCIDLYVRVMLNHDIRMDRLVKREKKRYGNRIESGGDLYEVNKERIEWANKYDEGGIEMRSLKAHKYYEKLYNVNPIIVNSENTVDENVNKLMGLIKV